MQGATPPQLCRIDDLGEDLNGEHAGAFCHAGDGLCRRRVVASRDARDVRAVEAVGQRAGDGRSGTELLIESVRAQRLADTGLGLRITGLLDDFSGEEWVRLVYAGIQHGDHGASAVVSRVPCLIGFDERRAVGEHREEQHVVEDAFDVGIERERGTLVSRQFEYDKGNRLKCLRCRARACGQPRQHLRDSSGDDLPLIDDRRGVRKVTFRNMARGKPQLHDHSSTLG